MNTNKNLLIEEAFNLAVKNHQEGKTDIAQNYYQKVLKIDPNNLVTHNNLGVIFQDLGENQKAKKSFEKAIDLNPNYVNAHYNLGAMFQESGENQKAISCYEKAIEINPNYADAYYNLGVVFKKLREHQKAKECYEKAIELNPNYSSAHYNLGNLFKELREIQKAKDCYEKAIEINPNYATAHNNLGNVFKDLGEYQKAKECYEKAIEINPNNAEAHNQILKLLYKLNNQSILFKKLDSITKEGKMNAVIGSIFSRVEVKYGVKKENPFCNDPLDYVLKTDLIKKCDFKNVIVDCVHNILKNDSISNRTQKLITNGYQTAGNLFANQDFDTHEIQRIIHTEIKKYRFKFKDSKEGFMRNWPTKYGLIGWLINMKKGGKLYPHMHDLGWLSGSIYVNIPKKLKDDDGNLVVCIDDDENKRDINSNKKSLDVVTGSLCLFPSSLLHYTIPFEAEEERIVLAFDVTPSIL